MGDIFGVAFHLCLPAIGNGISGKEEAIDVNLRQEELARTASLLAFLAGLTGFCLTGQEISLLSGAETQHACSKTVLYSQCKVRYY